MLIEILNRYLEMYPDEVSDFETLRAQLADDEKMNDRRNFRGHITSSGAVLNPDRTKILLIHHKGFNRWQQPGGHWESDDEASPLDTARRECEEETAVEIAEYIPVDASNEIIPLDIDTHDVPARPHKDEPDHVHHDWRYTFIAASEKLHHQSEEVNAAEWFDLDAPETKYVRTIIEKLRGRGITAA